MEQADMDDAISGQLTRWCGGCRSDKPATEFAPTSRRCRACMNISARRRRAIDYEAELERQDGTCAICKKPPGGWRGKFVIDHDPATGNFRGLLCEPCNLLLGNAQEDATVLAAAIEYLGKPGRQVKPNGRTPRKAAPVHISYREPSVQPQRLVPSPGMRVQDIRITGAR